MSYRKHFAYYSRGDFKESYLCVCERTGNHMVDRQGSRPAEPTLFEVTVDGEMRVS